MKHQTSLEQFHIESGCDRIVIITGMCRSGKTSIAQLVSKMDNVLYYDEPWSQMIMTIASGMGLVDKHFAKGFLNAITRETVNDGVLLRNANFRPYDLSSIWKQLPVIQIIKRTSLVKNRSDVKKYIDKKKPALLYVLSETNIFIDLIRFIFPKAKIILVQRNKNSVVKDLVIKGWFSTHSLVEPENAVLYRTHKKYYVPWWVDKEEEERFINMTEMERAEYYYERFHLADETSIAEFENKDKSFIRIDFDKYSNNTEIHARQISDFLGLKINNRVRKAIKDMGRRSKK